MQLLQVVADERRHTVQSRRAEFLSLSWSHGPQALTRSGSGWAAALA